MMSQPHFWYECEEWLTVCHISSFHCNTGNNLKGKCASSFFNQYTTPRLILDAFYTTLPQGGGSGLAQIFPLNLHLGTLLLQTAKVNTGRHHCWHLPRYILLLPVYSFCWSEQWMTTHTFSKMPVGGSKQPRPCGASQHLPPPHTIWSHGDNPVRFICHFPSRDMWRPQEAQVWHGLSPPSTSSGGRGGKEIQPSCCMGPSLSSPSPLTGWGSEKACLTYQYQGGLALHRHAVVWGLLAHPPLQCQAPQHHGRWCTQ